MEQKQTVTIQNIKQMLRPCTITDDFCSTLYSVVELKADENQHTISYAFAIRGSTVDIYKPTKCSLSGGICDSLAALQPIFKELDFEPVAFVTVDVQGPLNNKFVDPETKEYDMRKHFDLGLRLPMLSFAQVQEQSKIFNRMHKFILRDKKTNKIKPMPYYIIMPCEDVMYDKIAKNKNAKMQFIKALKKMRQK